MTLRWAGVSWRYAMSTMTGEVKRHFRDRTWGMRMPRPLQELRLALRTARQEFDVIERCIGDFGDPGIGLDRAACLHTDELFAWEGARLVRFQLGNEGGGLRTPA
jgi:hypothetical protein